MIASLKMYQRLGLAVALPIVLLSGLAAYDLSVKWKARSEVAELGPLVEGVGRLSRFIHELQRERGASAVFLGSEGAQLRTELPKQRKRADAERDAAMKMMAALGTSAVGEFKSSIGEAERAVATLDERRNEIDAQTITAGASSTYFTDTIVKLLAVTNEIARVGRQSSLAVVVSSYVNFIHGKERAGQERAFAAGSVAMGRFDVPVYARVLGLAAAQQVYFDVFEATANPEQRELYHRTLVGPVVDTVVRMREIIAKGGLSGDMKGLDGKAWYEATTARIDTLKIIEDRLAADLAARMSDKQSEANQALFMLAVLVAVAFAASVTLVLVMARSITGPLGKLSMKMRDLAGGKLSVEIEGADRDDEIGLMAKAVLVFKESMTNAKVLASKEETAISERAARAVRVDNLTQRFDSEISAVLKSVASAIAELQECASSMTATAGETSNQATTVATATEQASTNVQSVAAASEELARSVSEIGRQVSQSSVIAQKAVAEANRTNETVQTLSNEAAKIGDVIKFINEIASQTNLLALNATIEAARAGEAGRGFAVVAAEVKNLAQQTAKATDQIAAQISSIQASSGEAASAIEGITVTINEMNEIASVIACAVEEQGSATKEIARNVQQAALGTGEIASNLAGVRQAAGDTGAAAHQVVSASSELSRQSETMRAQVESFLSTIRAA